MEHRSLQDASELEDTSLSDMDLLGHINVDTLFDEQQADLDNKHAVQDVEGMSSCNPFINVQSNFGLGDPDYISPRQSNQYFSTLPMANGPMQTQSTPIVTACEDRSSRSSPVPAIHKVRKQKRNVMICPGCSEKLPAPLGHGTSHGPGTSQLRYTCVNTQCILFDKSQIIDSNDKNMDNARIAQQRWTTKNGFTGYTCRRCGLPKKGHTCLFPNPGKRSEAMPMPNLLTPNSLTTVNTTRDPDISDHIDANDMLDMLSDSMCPKPEGTHLVCLKSSFCGKQRYHVGACDRSRLK
jgi:hypothetical protein